MPAIGNKGKSKPKDNRQSRSRNTTPSSVVSAPTSAVAGSTAYLEIPIGSLAVPTNILYDDILERHGGNGGIPDPRNLESLANDLRTLSQLAAERERVCDGGMRELSGRRKLRIEEERVLEQANREAEEKASLKRAAEDDELERSSKLAKMKRKKDQGKPKEERPLTHGAHGLARQDGLESAPKVSRDTSSADYIRALQMSHFTIDQVMANYGLHCLPPVKPSPSPSKAKGSTASGSSSSLSPPSQAQSPTIVNQAEVSSIRSSPAPSSSSDTSHQPPPAASIPQYQTFGANPLTFDDPTIYHVREVTLDMTDEEKQDIYCVASFPHDDLSDLIAGNPPDRDFSNAKPTNQVNANTFAAYLEPYFRPLTEEDMAFLKERGDRVTPFVMPRRGTKPYTQVWAEEDGAISVDSQVGRDRLPSNQSRGSLEQMDDDVAETDQISAGPMLNRLLSTMRFEHRPEDKERMNGMLNGDSTTNTWMNGDSVSEHNADSNDDRPSATLFAESNTPGWKVPGAKQDYSQVEERLKAELRYIGFLGQDDEPDYDAHFDDEVAQRLRLLQSELRRQMIINGARKTRLAQIADEHMAYQEFATIRDDLDSQVVQAFSKRNRTLGKGKKNVKRPGGAGGGSHYPAAGAGAGIPKPGIGDVARSLMDRRRRWNTTIGPVFTEDATIVKGSEDSIFLDADMAPVVAAEKDRLEEEVD